MQSSWVRSLLPGQSSQRESFEIHLLVNLVGRSARDHPGQSQKYMWTDHLQDEC